MTASSFGRFIWIASVPIALAAAAGGQQVPSVANDSRFVADSTPIGSVREVAGSKAGTSQTVASGMMTPSPPARFRIDRLSGLHVRPHPDVTGYNGCYVTDGSGDQSWNVSRSNCVIQGHHLSLNEGPIFILEAPLGTVSVSNLAVSGQTWISWQQTTAYASNGYSGAVLDYAPSASQAVGNPEYTFTGQYNISGQQPEKFSQQSSITVACSISLNNNCPEIQIVDRESRRRPLAALTAVQGRRKRLSLASYKIS